MEDKETINIANIKTLSVETLHVDKFEFVIPISDHSLVSGDFNTIKIHDTRARFYSTYKFQIENNGLVQVANEYVIAIGADACHLFNLHTKKQSSLPYEDGIQFVELVEKYIVMSARNQGLLFDIENDFRKIKIPLANVRYISRIEPDCIYYFDRSNYYKYDRTNNQCTALQTERQFRQLGRVGKYLYFETSTSILFTRFVKAFWQNNGNVKEIKVYRFVVGVYTPKLIQTLFTSSRNEFTDVDLMYNE
jgi:hypothetical protein